MEDFHYAQEFFDEVKRIKEVEHNPNVIEKRAEHYLKDKKYYPRQTKNIAVISNGGGVGKTTTAANLALDIRKKTFSKVVVLELDLSNPNLEITLSHLLKDGAIGKGKLSSILPEPLGILKEGELGKRNVNGTLMNLIDSRIAITLGPEMGEPRIGVFFSDLRGNVETNQVYEKILSTFKRISTYTPKSEDRKRIDYLICDFCAGSMSNPSINRLMGYFDYRILVVVPDPKGKRGIENTIWNDEKREFRREEAVNILVLNKLVPGIGETISFISDTKGRGFNEAKALAEDMKGRLKDNFRVDYDVEVLKYPSVNQEDHTSYILKPAVINRHFNNEGYRRSIDELTSFIVNDTIKKAYNGGK